MNTKASHRFWLWVARPEYYLEQDGSDRADLQPSKRAKKGYWWTCDKDTHKGDLILLYRTAPKKDIAYLIEAGCDAYEPDPAEVDNPNWQFVCDYRVLQKFLQPLTLRELRADAMLQNWTVLRQDFQGRVFPIEQPYWERLRELLAARNPNTFDALDKAGQDLPDRPLVIVRRQLRDSNFGRRVREKSEGKCGACSSCTDYERLGILEAAHIRGVEDKGSDELSNALALCPNHHALFDEGKWTLNGNKIVLSRNLPKEIRESFGRRIKCGWDLDPKEVEWHRKTRFGKQVQT